MKERIEHEADKRLARMALEDQARDGAFQRRRGELEAAHETTAAQRRIYALGDPAAGKYELEAGTLEGRSSTA